MVKIVPLGSKPDDEAGVASYAQNTKHDLGLKSKVEGWKREIKLVMRLLGN